MDRIRELNRPIRELNRPIREVSARTLRLDGGNAKGERLRTGTTPGAIFALVAPDLLGERPLDAIALATRITSVTVEAFEQR